MFKFKVSSNLRCVNLTKRWLMLLALMLGQVLYGFGQGVVNFLIVGGQRGLFDKC